MKTAIIYATKYGCTEKCANILEKKLGGEVDVYHIKTNKNIELAHYDRIIIGGSIYIGRIQKEIQSFSSENKNIVKDKKLGLFICCMREGEEAQKQLQESFPHELIESATATACFGGAFDFSKMNFMDRLIAKKVAKVDKNTSSISQVIIDNFVELLG